MFCTPTVGSTLRELREELRLLTSRAEICIDEHIRTRRTRSGSRPDPLRPSRSGLVELLVIDEAERLSSTALEYVRDQFDRTGIGVVLIGMPGIERRTARYPQLYSRVGFAHHYRPLQGDELSFVLTRQWRQLGLTLDEADFTDSQAISLLPGESDPARDERREHDHGYRPRPPPRHTPAPADRRARGTHSVDILRVCRGLLIAGFGALKFFPGVSPAQPLVTRAVDLLTFTR